MGGGDPFGLACCPYISALNTEERKVIEGLSDKIASGKLHTRVRHGHFENVKDIENIINNPKEIFRSGGKNPRLIFHDGENVVIVGTKGSEKGWVVTNYGPLGSEGRVSLGSIPNTPRGELLLLKVSYQEQYQVNQVLFQKLSLFGKVSDNICII